MPDTIDTQSPQILHGQTLLSDPIRDKGTAFTLEERRKYGLEGLLPYAVDTLDRQVERVMQHLDGIVVTSQIIPQQGTPITLDWRLGVSDGHYRIKDVDIDGVSMLLAQRSEIADLLARQGGQLAQLFATMRTQG